LSTLIVSWVVFPFVVALLGAGWGTLLERAAGASLPRPLLVPLGAAAIISAAGLLTSFTPSAPAATPLVTVVGVAGLVVLLKGNRRVGPAWPLIPALGAFLVYGAPVLFSGQATISGYHILDDSSDWLGIADRLMSHGRSLSGLPQSSYSLLLTGLLSHSGYPVGSVMLLGVGRVLLRTDGAWLYQPYLALCAALLALSLYVLFQPLIVNVRVRAALAFLAAQPALLYGYAQVGADKELTASFLLALGAVLARETMLRSFPRPRQLLPIALPAGALTVVYGPAAAVWGLPLLCAVAVPWLWRAAGRSEVQRALTAIGWLAGLSAAAALPALLVARSYLLGHSGLVAGTLGLGFRAARRPWEALGVFTHPLSVFQLAGVWPTADFRATPSKVPAALLIALVIAAAAVGLWKSARRRELGPFIYLGSALVGAAAIALSGSSGSPWLTAEGLAIGSPAVLGTALAGGALLQPRGAARRTWTPTLAALPLVIIAGGVLWSNALAYRGSRLAPHDRFAELKHIGTLLSGAGPTLFNQDNQYATRHFLREGQPVGTSDYRKDPLTAPLRDGQLLSDRSWAPLDAFAIGGILPFRSIVIARSPAESRPPYPYVLRWQGRYYEIWQRPTLARPKLEWTAFGDSPANPFCGRSSSGAVRALCPSVPASVPPCPTIARLGRLAAQQRASLIAFQRPAPIVAHADQLELKPGWLLDPASRSAKPTSPGEGVARFSLVYPQRYALWLGGSFTRGFAVTIDGRRAGVVKNEPASDVGYVEVARRWLDAGVHTVRLHYPSAELGPGSEGNDTILATVALEPLDHPPARLIQVSPQSASHLCGRSLNWVEIAGGS